MQVTVLDCGGRTRMVEREQIVMALPFQVAPFPAAEPRRAVFEQAIDAVDVIGRPFAFGKGHPVEVEEALGPLLLGGLGLPCHSVARTSRSSCR